MKKVFNLFRLFFLTVCVLPYSVSATHLVGAEITYTPVPGSPNHFIVSLIVYRYCAASSATLGNTASISWDSPSGCGTGGNATLNLVPGTGPQNYVQTSEYPPCETSVCATPPGTAYGVEQYIYTGEIVFSGPCTDWEISYSNCCRNSNITTGPNDEGMYIQTTIDNLNYPADNSPVFNFFSAATTCVGRPYVLDMSATDPDGDSLVYILSDAWTAAGSPVNYDPPYSGSYPISSSPLPTIDPHTGLLTLYPNMVQIGVLAVLVESYDRTTGALISTIRRDMQINVELVCNDPPRLDSVHVSMKTVTVPCGDSVLHMKLTWQMRCNTLAADGSDFRLLGPDGIPILIRGAIAHNCNALGLSDSVTLFLRRPLCVNGIYAILSKTGYDGNTLLNGCGQSLPEFDTLDFSFTNCWPGVPDLYNVTVDQFDDSQCNLAWSIPSGLDTALFYSYEIFRSQNGPGGPYYRIASNYQWNDTTYIDADADPDVRPYSYGVKIQLKNCYISPMSDTIQSMHLTCAPNADSLSIDFNWTGFWGWDNPTYEIWMSNGTDSTLVLFDTTKSTAYNYLKNELGNYIVRIKTTGPTGLVSYSNRCSFEVLKNDPEVPNVITPNGDGKNDFFAVRNIHVYPDNTLVIFNRWGKKVYEKEGYNNEWDGGGLKDGTYFYVLTIRGRRPFEFHGTLNIFNK
jgi:gliding motility-associated-like protein